MTKLQKKQLSDATTYMQTCEEFDEQPQLLEAHFLMGAKQEREYKAWSREQHLYGVNEPTRADFLLSSIKPKVMVAGAGR
jgi:hypothetical protein